MVMNNRENYRRENKTKGMDDNEIKRNLDTTVENEVLIENQGREDEILWLKGPWCNEFMLNHEDITGSPQFHHLKTKIS